MYEVGRPVHHRPNGTAVARLAARPCDKSIGKCALAADGEVASGSFTSPLVESLVANMITTGGARSHVERLRTSLARRAWLLADAINAQQPAGKSPLVQVAPAGYFLWVDLPGLDADELRERCLAEHGVAFLAGPRCALTATPGEPSSEAGRARVCFAFLEEDELVEAGRRLGRAIAEARS